MNKHTRSLISIFYLGTAVWSVGRIFLSEVAGISTVINLGIALAPTMWHLWDGIRELVTPAVMDEVCELVRQPKVAKTGNSKKKKAKKKKAKRLSTKPGTCHCTPLMPAG